MLISAILSYMKMKQWVKGATAGSAAGQISRPIIYGMRMPCIFIKSLKKPAIFTGLICIQVQESV
jgi:hypothetical protein